MSTDEPTSRFSPSANRLICAFLIALGLCIGAIGGLVVAVFTGLIPFVC
jgi:hypothetical protein